MCGVVVQSFPAFPAHVKQVPGAWVQAQEMLPYDEVKNAGRSLGSCHCLTDILLEQSFMTSGLEREMTTDDLLINHTHIHVD